MLTRPIDAKRLVKTRDDALLAVLHVLEDAADQGIAAAGDAGIEALTGIVLTAHADARLASIFHGAGIGVVAIRAVGLPFASVGLHVQLGVRGVRIRLDLRPGYVDTPSIVSVAFDRVVATDAC
jgi:hypothetical protein